MPRLARDISDPPPSRAVNATFTLHAALFPAHLPLGLPMRTIFAIAFTSAVLASTFAAQAEKRVFIIGNDAGYGVDHCLANGGRCGSAAATAFCRGHEFRQAVSYRKVDRDDITGTVPTDRGACRGGTCTNFLAIECAR